MKNIRLLEERITRAAKRLRQLSEEKKGLEAELVALRRELDERPVSAPTEEAWMEERSEMVRSIEETLDELRAE